MYLTRLEVRHLRNLTSVSLSPAAGLNILEGQNASGKTSLLEAIHLLGLARSFRTLKTTNIVQHGEPSLTLFAELNADGQRHRLGLQRFRDNRILMRLDGKNIEKRAELANLLPFLLITPDSVSLLTGSPRERRQFIDWTVFHVEHSFHVLWSHYQRFLKQRNALLRNKQHDDIAYWDKGLAQYGQQIDLLRQDTLAELLPHIRHYCDQLIPDIAIDMEYRRGWKSDRTLLESLSDSLSVDSKQRFTSVGPHRAEVIITSKGKRVAEYLSRGQLKLLLCCLRLGQMAYLKQQTGKTSLVLIDDLPAELDANHRRLLLEMLHELQNQVFISATDRLELDYREWHDVKVFHVEHGEIEEVV